METKDKYKNARAFIVLLAALITWLLNMKYERSLVRSLIIFYVIATIALKLIDKIRNMEEVKEVDMEEAPPEEEGTDAQNHV